jgi:pyruvate/2-oxoglutarate dehydrogenase complex dihydrolipoamide dehydrogenase (E3) component
VQTIIKKIEPHDSIERYTSLGVECINDRAKIVSPYEVEVSGKVYTTKNIVVATGASAFIPPIKGIETAKVYTSENIWSLEELPKKFVVMGGGAIGCELAQTFARLGSEVTIVEKGAQLLAKEDLDAARLIEEQFKKEGIAVLTSHEIIEIKGNILYAGDKEIAADVLFCALGRKANTAGFGLQELGVELRTNASIKVDTKLRTLKYPNIFACGDVVGDYQFTHTASHQAWFACVNALFAPFKSFNVDYRVIPWATYTAPEVARVGLNEKEAKEQNIAVEVTKYDLKGLDRAVTASDNYGFVKVLTAKGKDKILGVTIVGAAAGDWISEFVLAMKHGIGLNKVLSTIHIYPTYTEANKFAAGEWKKKHAPEGLLKIVKAFHRWRL